MTRYVVGVTMMNKELERINLHLSFIARGEIYYDAPIKDGDHISIPMRAKHTVCKEYLDECRCK